MQPCGVTASCVANVIALDKVGQILQQVLHLKADLVWCLLATVQQKHHSPIVVYQKSAVMVEQEHHSSME